MLHGPDEPRVEGEVAGAVGDLGDAGHELRVKASARGAHAEMIKAPDALKGFTQAVSGAVIRVVLQVLF